MENHHFSWENPLFQWPFSIATLNYQRVIWRYWTEYWACRFKFQSVPTSSHLASRRMGARSKAPRPCPAELKDSHPWKERKMLPVGSQNQLCLGCPRIVEAFKVCGSPTQSHIFWRYEDEEGNHGNQEFDSVPSVNYIIGFPTPNFFIQEAGAQVFAIPHQEVLLQGLNIAEPGVWQRTWSSQGAVWNLARQTWGDSWFAVPTKQTKHAEQKNPTKLRPLHYLQAIWSLQAFRSTPKRRVQRMQDDSFPQQRKTQATCGSTPLEVETSPFPPYAIFEYFQDLYHNVYILYTYYVFNVLHYVTFSPHTSLSINISTGKHL